MVLGAVVLGAVAVPAQAQTYLVLRPVPPKDKKDRKKGNNGIITTPLKKSDIGELKLNGKATEVTAISPLLGGDFGLQLVVLLDSMEKIGVNEQFDDMRKLFDHLPPNVEIGVGYMLQGKIRWAQLPTKDRKLAGDALKEPEDTASPKNDNGGPYNCLKYLSNHWPDPDPKKMRAVLMITDGVNRYNSFQGSDQDDPDVVAAAALLVRSGIMPFPFFYLDPVIPQGRSEGGQMDGQTNFDLLAATTQGYPLWEGQYAPATFDPLLEKFFSVLESMSVVTLNTTGNGYKQIDVTSSDPSLGINAPDGVTLGNVLKTKFSPNEK
jgi:hypothetical protein